MEAIDKEGTIGRERLQQQCNYYKSLLDISEEEMIAHSYSDLLLQK
ncbi:MAG: hypothetical protein Q7S74_04540 [Nanoarchaeota archaeon]|nr:hypothetical protein [Nanoarchaeota archaeon]